MNVLRSFRVFIIWNFTSKFTVELLYGPRTASRSSFDAWSRELRWKAFSWPIWECGLGRLWAAVMAGLAGLCNGPHLFTLGQRAPTADERSQIRWLALHHSHSSALVLDAFPLYNSSPEFYRGFSTIQCPGFSLLVAFQPKFTWKQKPLCN